MTDKYMVCGTCEHFDITSGKCSLTDNPTEWCTDCCADYTLASENERRIRGNIAVKIGKIQQSSNER